jgi:hypothetical protein
MVVGKRTGLSAEHVTTTLLAQEPLRSHYANWISPMPRFQSFSARISVDGNALPEYGEAQAVGTDGVLTVSCWVASEAGKVRLHRTFPSTARICPHYACPGVLCTMDRPPPPAVGDVRCAAHRRRRLRPARDSPRPRAVPTGHELGAQGFRPLVADGASYAHLRPARAHWYAGAHRPIGP